MNGLETNISERTARRSCSGFGRATRRGVFCFLLAAGLSSVCALAGDDDRDWRRWDVEVARYGQGDRFVDVTRYVRTARRGDGELDFLVINENLGGDPLPNVPKRLDVLFRIGDRRLAVSVPENEHLFAPVLVRRVIAASYHPRDMEPHAFCREHERERCVDVTDRVRAHMRDGVLEMPVNNNELGGDPFPDVPKQLTVRFLARGDEREVTIDENSFLRIPENWAGDPDLVRRLMEYRDHRDHDRDHDRDRDRDRPH